MLTTAHSSSQKLTLTDVTHTDFTRPYNGEVVRLPIIFAATPTNPASPLQPNC
jgi:hypothetical protein